MKEKWLNLILKLTNRIYQRRESELATQGWKSITNVFVLIWLEIILVVISLPLYLTVSSAKATAYLTEKGGYAKIAVDYKLRRILTLTGVGVIFIIWVIKFMLIMLTPTVYGPLSLYNISELQPADINRQDLILKDTGIQTARVTDLLPIPHISGVEKLSGNKYRFFGTGKVGEDVVLFLTGRQNVIYVEKVGQDGNWQIEHSQSDIKLLDGVHSIFIIHYNKDQGIRSGATPENYFRVQSSILERISTNVDNLANWSVVIIIIVGIILTFLTL